MPFATRLKYLPRERFVIAVLALLSTIIFLNLNGAAFLLFGEQALLSPLIALLVFCALVVGSHVTAFVTARLGKWYIAFVMAYLLFGLLSGVFFGLRDLVPSVLWSGLTNILTVASFYTGAYILGQRDRLYEAMSFLRILMTIMAISIVASPLYAEQLPSFYDFDTDRFAGLFGNPNVAASFCCIGFALALAQIQKYSVATVIQALTFFAAIATTFSKSGFLAFLLISLTFALRSSISARKNWGVLVTISALAGFLLIVGLFLIFEVDTLLGLSFEQVRRLDSIRLVVTSGMLDDETTTNRAGLFQLAFGQWQESPVFGIGLGAMHLVDGSEWGVHNTFMLVLGESGIFPFLFLLGLCIPGARWGWRNFDKWEGRFVLGYAIGFIASCLTSHNVLEDRFHNAMIGICIAIVLLDRMQSRRVSTIGTTFRV